MQSKRSQSRGHIEERSLGSFTIWVSGGFDPLTGKRVRLSATVRGTKTDANKKLTDLLSSLDKGTYVKPVKMTLGQHLTYWLEAYAATNVRARTAESYREIIEGHLNPQLGLIPLASLTPSHVQAYYAKALASGRRDGKEGGLSGTTVLHHHRLLKKTLKDAVKWGLVVRNVADAVDAPRATTPEMHTLDEDAVDRFLDAARPTPYYSLYLVDLHTGLRRSELLGLRWRDIDLDRGALAVARSLHRLRGGRLVFEEPKSKKGRRQVALGLTPILALRGHKERQQAEMASAAIPWTEDALVFAHWDGTPLLPNTVTHAFEKIIKRAGLHGIRLHDLRHTHATLLLRGGTHPKVVQERLGHSTIAMTLDLYSHVTPDMQEDAVRKYEERLAARQVQKAGER